MSTRTPLTATATALAALMALTSCAAKEPTMTPQQTSDQLVKIIHDTAALIPDAKWKLQLGPAPGPCTLDDGTDGVSYDYDIDAPPLSTHLADAQKVAAYWKTLGITVRLVATPVPVVYGTGGPIHTIGFSTAPGLYGFGGESLCVPGDSTKIIEEEPSPTPS